MTDRPTRCCVCQSKLLQPHSMVDTFDRVYVAFWHCAACGVQLDWKPHGRKGRHRFVVGNVRPITLAPNELNTLGVRS